MSACTNISSPIRDELGLPQGFDHVPGNKVSLAGILNLSEKRLAVEITVWSDELLVQSDDNELDEDVREKLYEKRKKKGKHKYHLTAAWLGQLGEGRSAERVRPDQHSGSLNNCVIAKKVLSLYNGICKRLDFIVFSDKEEKP